MPTDNQRIKTGVEGFDKMLNGGFVGGRNILLSGPAGSGKSTFAMHFVQEGVKQSQQSLYLTLEESKKKLYDDTRNFGIDLEQLERTGYFQFIGGPLAEVSDYMKKVDATSKHLIEEIQEIIEEKKVKRVVIDSINLFNMLSEKEKEKRGHLAKLCNILSAHGVTALLLSEIPEGLHKISKEGIEEFIVDGVIVLYHFKEGAKFIPGIGIRKMRGTNHEKEIKPYAITDNGVEVYPDETLFAEF